MQITNSKATSHTFQQSALLRTGKANLPGSRRERQLLRSFARMAPELIRHSAKPALAFRFKQKLRNWHKPQSFARSAPKATNEEMRTDNCASTASLWGENLLAETCVIPAKTTKRKGKQVRMEDVDPNDFEHIFNF